MALARAQAKFKGTEGVVELSQRAIRWFASNPAKEVTVPVSEIKVHCVSAPSSKRLFLKVVTASRDPKAPGYMFEFISKLHAQQERERFVGALAGLFAKGKQSSAAEGSAAPAAGLGGSATDPEVLRLYQDLVGTGVMSDAEFWAQRREMAAPATAQSTASQEDKKRNLDTSSDMKRKITLTAAEIKKIFKTQPQVLRKYKDSVPDQMTEKEFWTRYMESMRFHGGASVHNINQGGDTKAALSAAQIVNRAVDLSTELDASQVDQEPNPKRQRTLLNTLNSSSLSELHSNPRNAGSAQRIHDDLSTAPAPQYIDMSTTPSTIGQEAAAHPEPLISLASPHSKKKLGLTLKRNQQAFLSWEPTLQRALGAQTTSIPMDSAFSAERSEGHRELWDEYKALHAQGSEHLRHYWSLSSRPLSPQSEKRKLRLKSAIHQLCNKTRTLSSHCEAHESAEVPRSGAEHLLEMLSQTLR